MILQRPSLLLAAVGMLAAAAPATAADLLYDQPAGGTDLSAPVAGDNWNGLYAGVQAGAVLPDEGFGNDVRSQSSAFTAAGPRADSFGDEGDATIGAHVGADLRFGNVVIGAVTDYSKLGVTTTADTRFGAGNGIAVQREVESLGTTRGRLGVASDRLLVYGTAGVAYGTVETRATLSDPANLVTDDTKSDRDHAFGGVVGAGADYMVTDKLSVGAEYTYTDLGPSRSDLRFEEGGGRSFTTRDSGSDIDFHRVEGKVSLHFF